MLLNQATLAERIQNERKRHHWTQTDLAHRASTSRATIARIEAGNSEHIAFETIQNILKAIGWQLDIAPGLPQPTPKVTPHDPIAQEWLNRWHIS